MVTSSVGGDVIKMAGLVSGTLSFLFQSVLAGQASGGSLWSIPPQAEAHQLAGCGASGGYVCRVALRQHMPPLSCWYLRDSVHDSVTDVGLEFCRWSVQPTECDCRVAPCEHVLYRDRQSISSHE